jgi:hypothetical protein
VNDGRPPAVADHTVDVPVSHLALVRDARAVEAIVEAIS